MKDILVMMTKRVSLLPDEKDFRVDFCVFNCLLEMKTPLKFANSKKKKKKKK